MRSDLKRRLEQLEATRAEVVARIEPFERERLNRPRADGGWSALQVLHHVILVESGTLRYISKKMRAGTSLPRAGFVSRLRRLALQVALVSPLRFRAPGVVAEVPDEIEPADLLTSWDETRGRWRKLVDEFPEEILDRVVFRHGWVGLMGLHDTLDFLQGHLDHHMRQVERRLRAD
jgi:hypothetical protein